MTRLEMADSIVGMIMKLSDGNPGALTVCKELSEQEPKIDGDSALQGIGALLTLDTCGIYAEDIWMLYKDVCGEDIEKTIAILRSCQLGFITLQNLKHAIAHYGEGIDLDNIVEQVKERLPNFGRKGVESIDG